MGKGDLLAARTRRRVGLLAIAASLWSVAAARAVDVQLAPPADNASAVGEVRFDLLVLNPSADVDPYRVPASLAVRLTTPGGVTDATATLVNGRAGELIDVAPHAFLRVPMTVRLTTVGRVTVELRGSTTPTTLAATVVEVRPPGAAGVTSAVDVGDPSTTRPAVANAEGEGVTLRNPFSIVTERDPNFRGESGLVEFLNNRIRPHEPVYFAGGDEDPSTKFQLSFKYQIFDPNGPLAQKTPGLGGLFFAYTQTSLWDLGATSSPFFDNSYKPEFLVSYDDLDRYALDADGDRALPDWFHVGLQAGYRHESNGRDGEQSRSFNVLFVRPIVTLSGEDGLFVTIAPRLFTYILSLDDNPDIDDYRGHAEVRVIVGRGGGLQLATTARLGDQFDKSSYQLDLSFPIRQLSLRNLDVYFFTTYFTGYGESLLNYRQDGSSWRFGVALVR